LKLLTSMLKGFRGLLSLLTTLPVGSSSLEEAAEAFYMAPLAGVVVGLLIAIALYPVTLLTLGFETGWLLVGSVYVTLHVIVTGGLHLDGFADYSDVVGSRASGLRALSILKDPRRGSYAVVAITLNLLLSVASAAIITQRLPIGHVQGLAVLLAVLASIYASSSESMFLVLSSSPPEPYEGMARLFSVKAKSLRSRALNSTAYTVSMILPALILASTLGLGETVAVLASTSLVQTVIALAVSRDATLRLGFANGDVAGFSYELSRVASLTTVAVALAWLSRV